MALPSGGGPFKGFAFVVVGSAEDAERILAAWPWEVVSKASDEGVKDEEGELERIVKKELEELEKLGDSPTDAEMKEEVEEGDEAPTKKKAFDPEQAARENGLRALT